MIIFAIIFVYLLFSATTYLNRDKIQFYEVVDGGIVNTRIYRGLILREEQVRNAERSGYINYYPVSYTHLDVYKRQFGGGWKEIP